MKNEAMQKEIGARLKQSRLALGMSQPEVAAALNRTPQAISKWELGKSMPAPDTWQLVGEVLGVSLDYLVYGIRTVPVSDSPMIAKIFGEKREQPQRTT